jgi:hypothetical protein
MRGRWPAFQVGALVATCGLLGLAAACSGGSSGTGGRSASPSAARASSAAGTTAEVVHVYEALQDEVQAAFASPEKSPSGVARYAYADARAAIYKAVLDYRRRGVRLTGSPAISPKVTSLDERGRTATIVDCFDDSGWVPVDAKTGRNLEAPGQNHRYPVTVHERQIAGRWYVVSSTPDRGKKSSPG